MSEKKGNWRTMDGIVGLMEETHERMLEEAPTKITVDRCFAESRLFSLALKTLDLRLQHAKMTGRLKDGIGNLPDVTLR